MPHFLPPTTDLFVSEDISKPENRINLALFHLQMVPAFHEWFMKSLGLQVTTVLYPVSNTEGNRPDFILRDERGQVVVVSLNHIFGIQWNQYN